MIGNGSVIKGNTINGGSAGIYLMGASTTLPALDVLIDSNLVNTSYYYGIYTSNAYRLTVQRNTVNMSDPKNATAYGIYGTNSDSIYQYAGNFLNINNETNTTTYGIYLTGCDASALQPGRVANNKISALAGNTGVIYGMYQT